MQTQAIVAEQTSRNRYRQPAPLPPREIELTVRLEIPEETGADVGINPSFDSPLPSGWDETLTQRLYRGVHGGLASVGAPLPDGGIGVHITHLHMSPPVDSESTTEDDHRLGDVLEALAASTVAELWTGAISLGAPSTPRVIDAAEQIRLLSFRIGQPRQLPQSDPRSQIILTGRGMAIAPGISASTSPSPTAVGEGLG